jgi:hypothetical protein
LRRPAAIGGDDAYIIVDIGDAGHHCRAGDDVAVARGLGMDGKDRRLVAEGLPRGDFAETHPSAGVMAKAAVLAMPSFSSFCPATELTFSLSSRART